MLGKNCEQKHVGMSCGVLGCACPGSREGKSWRYCCIRGLPRSGSSLSGFSWPLMVHKTFRVEFSRVWAPPIVNDYIMHLFKEQPSMWKGIEMLNDAYTLIQSKCRCSSYLHSLESNLVTALYLRSITMPMSIPGGRNCAWKFPSENKRMPHWE